MPDWKHLIHARLVLRGKGVPCDEETLTELANHLEELFDHWRALGFSEAEAISRALTEVPDWKDLFLKIQRARSEEDHMNVKDKAIWVPCIIALLVTLCGLIGALRNGLFPWGLGLAEETTLLIYVPWLGTNLLTGFFAAYVSKRIGGHRNESWTVALFVSVILLVLFFRELVVYGVVAGHVRTWAMWGRLSAFVISWFSLWVVIPSLVLLAGALLFWNLSEQLSLKSKTS